MTREWKTNVLLKDKNTVRIGGPADYFDEPNNLDDLILSLEQAKKQNVSLFVLGGGSDVVFADEGFRGLVMRPNLSEIKEEGGFLYVGSGLPWGELVQETFKRGYVGLEDFARIPCRVGGAIYNNIHGDCGHFFSEFIDRVKALQLDDNKVITIDNTKCDFGYDQSIFHNKKYVVLGCWLKLNRVSEREVIIAKENYLRRIKEKAIKQPSEPSSGSVFKNPDRNMSTVTSDQAYVSVGQMVDECGLKGMACGGMQISPKHGNFIVNMGGGKQAEFLQLCKIIQEEVANKYHITIHREVEFLDEFGELIHD